LQNAVLQNVVFLNVLPRSRSVRARTKQKNVASGP
jgi:hypothetical protein